MWDVDLKLNKVYNVIPELFDCEINNKFVYTILDNGKITYLRSKLPKHKGHFIIVKKIKTKFRLSSLFSKREISGVLIKCIDAEYYP